MPKHGKKRKKSVQSNNQNDKDSSDNKNLLNINKKKKEIKLEITTILLSLPSEVISLIFPFLNSQKDAFHFALINSQIYSIYLNLMNKQIDGIRLYYLNEKQKQSRNFISQFYSGNFLPTFQITELGTILKILDNNELNNKNLLFNKEKQLNNLSDKTMEGFLNYVNTTAGNLGKILIKILKDFNEKNKCQLVIAGGFVANYFINNEYTTKDNEIENNLSCPDLDIFMLENGVSPEETSILLREVLQKLDLELKKEKIEYAVLKNSSTINLISKNDNYDLPLQFILRRVYNMEELLNFFDLDVCRFSYDCKQSVFTTKYGLRCLITKKNILGKEFIKNSLYFKRAIKYSYRGINTECIRISPFHHLLSLEEMKKEIDNGGCPRSNGEDSEEEEENDKKFIARKDNNDMDVGMYSVLNNISYKEIQMVIKYGINNNFLKKITELMIKSENENDEMNEDSENEEKKEKKKDMKEIDKKEVEEEKSDKEEDENEDEEENDDWRYIFDNEKRGTVIKLRNFIDYPPQDIHYFLPSLKELLAKDYSLYYTNGYFDSHLLLKYYFQKCYICGMFTKDISLLNNEVWDERLNQLKEKIKGKEDSVTKLSSSHVCSICKKFNAKQRKLHKDLTGKIAIVTGGRIKIGYETALKLLRCGATVIVTTRFIENAKERYQKEKDYNEFKSRLHFYSLNLKYGKSICQFKNYLIENGFNNIHILINNAAQTVRRPIHYYRSLIKKEKIALGIYNEKEEEEEEIMMDDNEEEEEIKEEEEQTKNEVNTQIMLLNAFEKYNVSTIKDPIQKSQLISLAVTESNLTKEDLEITPEEINVLFPRDKKDKFGEPVDKRILNSWHYKLNEIDDMELLEVQMINNIAPQLLVSELFSLMKVETSPPYNNVMNDGPRYVINVTSHEGQFHTIGKNENHPHTNISKAALNMLTRSSSSYFAKNGIIMNSVDTGWISSSIKTFQTPPLTCEDGAARILYPILTSSIRYGVLYKDFKVTSW